MNTKVLLILSALTVALSSVAQQKRGYLTERLPASWSGDEIFEQTLPAEDRWWMNFEDTRLDSLIAVACRRNPSVLSAIESMRMAEASWHTAQGALLPSFDIDAGWQRSKSSGSIYATDYKQTWGGYFDATLSTRWQIDLFGSIYKRSRMQKHLFRASEDEYKAVLVTLCANVATTYFTLQQNLAMLDVLRENAASQKEILGIVEVRYSTGLASKLDVAQARSVYYSTQANLPTVETAIDRNRNSLATLLGEFPSVFEGWKSTPYSVSDNIQSVAVGVPANLIRRRPDVRSAEERVQAYAAQLGATRQDWLPEIYLNGSIGFSSDELKRLPRSRSLTWEIAPSITWNLFDGGRTVNEVKAAKAQLDQSIIEFNATVLTAVQETESAMSAYRNSIKLIVALRETLNQGRETLRLSLELYKQGLTTFQNVLDAQRTMLSYQNNLVQAQGSSLIALVQLYQALGGGW